MGPLHTWKLFDSTGLKEDLTVSQDVTLAFFFFFFEEPDIHNDNHLSCAAFSLKDCYELYAVLSNHKEQNGSVCIPTWRLLNTVIVTDKRYNITTE